MRRKRVLISGMRFRKRRTPNDHPPARAVRPRIASCRRNAVRISARNQIKGKILEVKKGATTAHVKVEIAPGQIITSSITNEAVEDLDLKVGSWAIVVIKASDVMIAVT
jgi:molybdopterin-binding protein